MLDAALLALSWTGTGLATLFAASRLWRRDASERWLGAGFGAAAQASGLVTASHSGFASPKLEAAEVAATLAAGPLVAHWAAQVVVLRFPTWASVAAFVPALAWALAGLAGRPFAADAAAIRWAVAVQMAWSAAAALLAWTRRNGLGAAPRRLLLAGLAGLGALHLAQLARIVAPRTTPQNLVPATLGCLLAALAYAALRRTRLRLGPSAPEDASEGESAQLVARLDDWLVGQRGLVEPRLTVAAAAERLGTTGARLSRAVNRRTGRSFSEHVAAVRVAEAGRLLVEPALAHLSVEAIGQRSGFGSRSVFFAEFRRRTGSSPAEFRQRRMPDVREDDSGPTSTARRR